MKTILTIALLTFSLTTHAADPALTNKLTGTQFTYKYSGGWEFTIKYETEGVSYRMLNYNTGWRGPFDYQAFEISNNVYFTGWFDTDREDYVTHYIDLNQKKLYGSVLIGKEDIHFQSATISRTKKVKATNEIEDKDDM